MGNKPLDFSTFPGGDLVKSGLTDLGNGVISESALLVSLAGPRLRGLGLEVPYLPMTDESYEHRLFSALEIRLDNGAHAAYNALIGRIVSFANSYSQHAKPLPLMAREAISEYQAGECKPLEDLL